ncbi:MAG TPA: 4Fe-4S dicluster domain-containing protein [Anaerolineaceae bacterium]|nr:4Fe-4S dicluster domain-containing protein [Anaerolineaceae bacterium]HQP09738.1 4Fe-4S dicluster domain-containing protein [Anaerolineaceae bacterium]
MYLEIDPQKCTGCMACMVFCALQHEGVESTQLSRIQILHDENRIVLLPITCIPCEDKPCIQVCPEGAIAVNELGAVVITETLCTGCGRCARACEIGAIRVHRLPGRGKNGRLVSLKCDLCGGDPWCVKACAFDAIRKVEDDQGGQAVYEKLKSARQELTTRLEDAGVLQVRRST